MSGRAVMEGAGWHACDVMSVDVEEWFHVCGIATAYADPATWASAPSAVERGTETLLRAFDRAGVRATFFVVGRVAELRPRLVARIVEAGHEIGCHGNLHRLVFEQTREEFEADLAQSLATLRAQSGQPVRVYRAPGFSITPGCYWAFGAMRRHGIEIDSSVAPARRSHGGAPGFPPGPVVLRTESGPLRCLPVSVMRALGRRVQFSGGGYLRLLPSWAVRAGQRQNRRAGRGTVFYVHPHDVDAQAPRLRLPALRRFKRHVGVSGCEAKLERLMRGLRLGTATEAADGVGEWPEYRVEGTRIEPTGGVWRANAAPGVAPWTPEVEVVLERGGVRLYSPPHVPA